MLGAGGATRAGVTRCRPARPLKAPCSPRPRSPGSGGVPGVLVRRGTPGVLVRYGYTRRFFAVTTPIAPRENASYTSPGKTLRRSRLVRAPLMVLFVLGAVCTIAAVVLLHTGADETTIGTLLVFGPRRFAPVAWLIAAVFMTALGARWVLASLALAVFSLFAFASFSVPRLGAATAAAAAAPDARTFRLVSFNVDHAKDIDILLELAVPRWAADVVVFQACGERAGLALQRASRPRARVLKVGEFCIASAHPLVRGTLIQLNSPESSERQAYAVHVRLTVGADTLSVVVVHLASPRSELAAALNLDFTKLKNSTATRSEQADRLARYLRSIQEPLVIAGDFNTLEESRIYQRYFARYSNAFRATGWGFGHTMQAGVHRIRIDHVLTGDGMQPVALNTEWNWPTEHRPVIATLAY